MLKLCHKGNYKNACEILSNPPRRDYHVIRKKEALSNGFTLAFERSQSTANSASSGRRLNQTSCTRTQQKIDEIISNLIKNFHGNCQRGSLVVTLANKNLINVE